MTDKLLKILLIDDELDFLEPMAYWLKGEGHKVVTEDNYENALKIIKDGFPDVVFIDIVMPLLDGIGVLKKIREFNKTIPIIMMSSFVKDSLPENDGNYYKITGIYCKGDDFTKAMALIKAATS